MITVKKTVILLIRIAVSAVLLLFLFRNIDGQMLSRSVAGANLGMLATALLIFVAIDILCFVRWRILLSAAGVVFPVSRIFRAFCGGIFFSLFLPSAIGGDLVRLADLSMQTKKGSAVVATGIIDRLAGYFGLVMVALCAAFVGQEAVNERIVFTSLVFLAAVLAVLVTVIFYPPVYGRINGLLCRRWPTGFCSLFGSVHAQMNALSRHPRILAFSLGLSLFIQAMSAFSMYLIAVSFGVTQPASAFFILMPVVSALTLLPISIAGLGVRDVSTVFFLAKIGVARDTALAISLMTFSFLAVIAAAAGVVYVFTLHHRRV